jgi:hypothetical protein
LHCQRQSFASNHYNPSLSELQAFGPPFFGRSQSILRGKYFVPIKFCVAALAPICALHHPQFAGSNSCVSNFLHDLPDLISPSLISAPVIGNPAVRRCFELFSAALTLYKQISAHKYFCARSCFGLFIAAPNLYNSFGD